MIALKRKAFFRDTHGRIVVFQRPNALLCGWFICMVVAKIASNEQLVNGLGQFGSGLLIAWAYLEITKGVNYFRRFLGLVVLAVVIAGFFR
jgi:hypothetical protein